MVLHLKFKCEYHIEDKLRFANGREPEPNGGILDSQSIKTTEQPEYAAMMFFYFASHFKVSKSNQNLSKPLLGEAKAFLNL